VVGAVEQDILLSDGEEKTSIGISSHMVPLQERPRGGSKINYITEKGGVTKIIRSFDHDAALASNPSNP
jgi:hypothetical protein